MKKMIFTICVILLTFSNAWGEIYTFFIVYPNNTSTVSVYRRNYLAPPPQGVEGIDWINKKNAKFSRGEDLETYDRIEKSIMGPFGYIDNEIVLPSHKFEKWNNKDKYILDSNKIKQDKAKRAYGSHGPRYAFIEDESGDLTRKINCSSFSPKLDIIALALQLKPNKSYDITFRYGENFPDGSYQKFVIKDRLELERFLNQIVESETRTIRERVYFYENFYNLSDEDYIDYLFETHSEDINF
jgi:hypothetical protein